MIQPGSNTENIDLQPLFVIKLVIPHQAPKEMKTLAQNIVHRNETKNKKNSVLQNKLAYGHYYEPIAIKHENYLRLSGYEVVVEPCGFVIDKNNLFLEPSQMVKLLWMVNLEVKCSEEYKNIDPKDICFISKNPPFLS